MFEKIKVTPRNSKTGRFGYESSDHKSTSGTKNIQKLWKTEVFIPPNLVFSSPKQGLQWVLVSSGRPRSHMLGGSSALRRSTEGPGEAIFRLRLSELVGQFYIWFGIRGTSFNSRISDEKRLRDPAWEKSCMELGGSDFQWTPEAQTSSLMTQMTRPKYLDQGSEPGQSQDAKWGSCSNLFRFAG